MIVVVEGISASGKSTWCRKHGENHVVPETGRITGVPDGDANPTAAARFWADQNAKRWASAVAAEQATGIAICDTDPLKLHYAWCLWQIGEASEERWLQERASVRQIFCEARIGFADAYFVKEVDPGLARLQRDGDSTRTRRNFDLHLRLQRPLMAWYRALGTVLPNRVLFNLPEDFVLPSGPGSRDPLRYDVAMFDMAIALLPRSPSS